MPSSSILSRSSTSTRSGQTLLPPQRGAGSGYHPPFPQPRVFSAWARPVPANTGREGEKADLSHDSLLSRVTNGLQPASAVPRGRQTRGRECRVGKRRGFRRATRGHQPPTIHHQHAVCVAARCCEIMQGCQQRRGPLRPPRAAHRHHVELMARIEGVERIHRAAVSGASAASTRARWMRARSPPARQLGHRPMREGRRAATGERAVHRSARPVAEAFVTGAPALPELAQGHNIHPAHRPRRSSGPVAARKTRCARWRALRGAHRLAAKARRPAGRRDDAGRQLDQRGLACAIGGPQGRSACRGQAPAKPDGPERGHWRIRPAASRDRGALIRPSPVLLAAIHTKAGAPISAAATPSFISMAKGSTLTAVSASTRMVPASRADGISRSPGSWPHRRAHQMRRNNADKSR